MDQTINPETQKMLNTPPVDPKGFDSSDQTFLNQIVAKIESGQINLYGPSSLFNRAVYDSLPSEKKAQVENQAFATLAALREIYNLWTVYQVPTFQLTNLLRKVRLTKEGFETEQGDVFIV